MESMNQAVALSQSYINGNGNFDADTVLNSIVDMLFADEDYTDTDGLALILDALSAIAPGTWYCCDCGPVSPMNGEIDALCPKCGALRRLPVRLSFPVWTAYVMAARRAFCDDWHERLGSWANQKQLLDPAQSSDDSLAFIDGMIIHKDGRTTGTNWIALPLPTFRELSEIL